MLLNVDGPRGHASVSDVHRLREGVCSRPLGVASIVTLMTVRSLWAADALVQTLLRTGSSNDTSPPAGCCRGTGVPREEPVCGV